MPQAIWLRMLCGAWLLPAASLIWIGLATTGIREASDASQAMALGRTQATALVLAVFTVLVGASAFVRQGVCDQQPADGSVPASSAPSRRWVRSHLLAGVVAIPLAAIGARYASLTPTLLPTAAILGFWAGLALPRRLVRCPGAWSGPLAALGVGMVFQLSIGWLHVANPTGTASPVLVAEGLILAWAAATAARVDPFALPATVPADEPASVELTMSPLPMPGEGAGGGPRLSSGSVPPSLPEAAVGR